MEQCNLSPLLPHREKDLPYSSPTQYTCLIQSANDPQDPLSHSLYPGYKSGLRTPIHRWFSLELAPCSNSVSHSNKLSSLILPHVWNFFSNLLIDHYTSSFHIMAWLSERPFQTILPKEDPNSASLLYFSPSVFPFVTSFNNWDFIHVPHLDVNPIRAVVCSPCPPLNHWCQAQHLLFIFLASPHGMRDPRSPTGIEPTSPALEMQNLTTGPPGKPSACLLESVQFMSVREGVVIYMNKKRIKWVSGRCVFIFPTWGNLNTYNFVRDSIIYWQLALWSKLSFLKT